MNVKTYNYVKYVGTFGALFLFIAPFLGFLHEWSVLNAVNNGGLFEHTIVFKSAAALAATLWVLEIVGIIISMAYLYIRTKLKTKSGYSYTKEDNKKLAISFMGYGVVIVFSFVYVIISSGIFGFATFDNLGTNRIVLHSWGSSSNSKSRVIGLMIAFAPMYVIQCAGQLVASIFETTSRVGEQAYLYQQQEEAKKQNGTAVSDTGTRRTKEAQKLFEDEEDKKSSKKKKSKSKQPQHKAEEHIDDKKALEDFFKEDDDDDEKDNK